MPFFDGRADGARSIELVTEAGLPDWLERADPLTAEWVIASGFSGRVGEVVRLPPGERIIAGVGQVADRWAIAAIPPRLPEGDYLLAGDLEDAQRVEAEIGWGMGCYRFDNYRRCIAPSPRLVQCAREWTLVNAIIMGDAICRDLSNTPAEDMGPAELENAARSIAEAFGAQLTVLCGADLLGAGYRLIHAVGRASPREPRLIDLRWGHARDPLIAIIGKGVCFDTGGLDMKNSAGMLDMKYDMGGAAHVLALAATIMRLELPVRLRMLVPAVDNAIGGNAIRPRDIIEARDGTTVEIGNTDAEGRLILAEPLAEAASEAPEILIDLATLTGAARVALGSDITALFCNDDNLAAEIAAAGERSADPVWRLPLWRPYAADLAGTIADLNNVADLNLGSTTQASAIYAALFLEHFVTPGTAWAHLDIMAGSGRARPGRPRGAMSRGLFAVLATLMTRFPYRIGNASGQEQENLDVSPPQ